MNARWSSACQIPPSMRHLSVRRSTAGARVAGLNRPEALSLRPDRRQPRLPKNELNLCVPSPGITKVSPGKRIAEVVNKSPVGNILDAELSLNSHSFLA